MRQKERNRRLELGHTLNECGRSFGIQHSFVHKAFDTELSIAANHILIDISANPSLRATDFAAEASLSKTEVSRLIRSLEELGLVDIAESKEDRRRKQLSLTEAGTELLSHMNAESNKRVERMCDRLTVEEQQKMLQFLAAVSEGLGARPLDIRVGLHPIRAYIEGLTRKKGSLSKNLYRVKGLNQLKWYVLKELETNEKPISLSSLAKSLDCPLNTISQAVAALTQTNFVRKRQDKEDKRRFLLSLTSKAKAVIENSDRYQAEQYSNATMHLPLERLEESIALAEKLVGLNSNSNQFLFGTGKRFWELKTEKERAVVRPSLIEHLVISRQYVYAQATLLGTDSTNPLKTKIKFDTCFLFLLIYNLA